MGQAMATRSLELAGLHDARRLGGTGETLDLTRPVTTQLPEHVQQAAADALDRGETHYTVRPGVPELREAVAGRLNDQGFSATLDRTVITNGGAEALYIALQATLTVGSRALVYGPAEPQLIEMIEFIGAEAIRIDGPEDNHFLPAKSDIEKLEADVLVLTSPSPVSGAALSLAEISDIAGSAVERGMQVILDRSLADCLYDPTGEHWPNKELAARVFVIGSFSTSHGLRGWQVGYFVSPDEQLGRLRELKQALSICTTAVSQYAALAALEGPQDWLADRLATFTERRDRTIERLRQAGFDVIQPDAYAPLLIETHRVHPDDRVVARRLEQEAGIIVEPGSRFGPATAGYIRVSLGCDKDVLASGIEAIAAMNRNGS